MQLQPSLDPPGLPIASVERETGLSKDTLRVWERRYGFPTPERDANGERLYATVQVRRLAQIKRLMDRGHRPGKLLALDEAALLALDTAPSTRPVTPDQQQLDAWLQLVKMHDSEALQRQFYREMAKRGLSRFVQDIVAPLITRIGEAWSRNELGIFEEHLFSQHLEKLFRTTLANMAPQAGSPRVLLTTLPGEEHTLGLLMVEALLVVEDAYPVLLGPRTPIAEIVRAAQLKQVDVVCLSFSSAYSPALATQGLRDLRQVLPESIEMWAGGYGVKPIRKPIDGVSLVPEFQDLYDCMARWQVGKGGESSV
ncbi:MAG: MerR family transcriptional regulator [Burkholderiaceae bacterium]|nr:MerR family transcriptional regulator [Burkholderiaceae bacterium]